MLTFTKEQIKEITDQLDTGFRAFYHKVSGELIFVPDTDKYYGMETEAWQTTSINLTRISQITRKLRQWIQGTHSA